MTEPLNLEAIRAAKAEAEQEIMDVLERLKERTGLCAVACSIGVIGLRTTADSHPRRVLASVTLSLESI